MRQWYVAMISNVSVHEVYPGHYVQFLFAPQFPSRARKVFGAATNSEGWAHYCEQMMVDAGFGRKDPLVRLGQLQEALVRLVRFVVSIRLHAEDLSVEQGVRMFREMAFLEEANARREAERGAFDPTYLVYSVGKLMLQKLRHDVEAKEGDAFSLRNFHDSLLKQGAAPFALHRRLMLGDTGSVLD